MSNHSELPSVRDNWAYSIGKWSALVGFVGGAVLLAGSFDEISASVKESGFDVSDVSLGSALFGTLLAVAGASGYGISQFISPGSVSRVTNAPSSEADQG